jgi:5'-methylthioadenosine phosphorylase
MNCNPSIGVFGGSGFYSLFERAEQLTVNTPYDAPSDVVTIGEIAGKSVAFLPRHGSAHSIPPHAINYRANLWAMKELGVRQIIGPCAAGSLSPDTKVGDFVICDQLVDRTSGRRATFYDGPIVTHVSFADPYCPRLRKLAIDACRETGVAHHESGTIVVIEGPRFSTRAESRWFTAMGWQVINMTQYPEAFLARELGLCYVNISIITDYDAGLKGHPDITPVTHGQVVKVFNENIGKLRAVIKAIVERMPSVQPMDECPCPRALDAARIAAR